MSFFNSKSLKFVPYEATLHTLWVLNSKNSGEQIITKADGTKINHVNFAHVLDESR